jgi:hypothetical protein
LGLVQAALARIDSRQQPSVEELFDPARGMDMSNHRAITRELINESITADEERAYMTWWAARPPDEAVGMRDYSAALRGLFRSLQALMNRKVDPAAAEVQALIDQWNQTALRYQLRKTVLELMDWNASIAQKWFDVGRRALARSVSSVETAAADDVWDYFIMGVKASGWSQALDRLLEEAAGLSKKSSGVLLGTGTRAGAALRTDLPGALPRRSGGLCALGWFVWPDAAGQSVYGS